jgi:hypothetical protein
LLLIQHLLGILKSVSALSLLKVYYFVNVGLNDLNSQQLQLIASATATSLQITVTVVNYTMLQQFTFGYLAIDMNFPYHLNVLNNIAITYLNTPLTIFSIPNPNPQIYTNNINYTTQTLNYGYTAFTNFSNPFSNYRIIAFINSMDLISCTGNDPISLQTDVAVTAIDTYQINVTFGTNAILNYLYYSLLVVDMSQMEANSYPSNVVFTYLDGLGG